MMRINYQENTLHHIAYLLGTENKVFVYNVVVKFVMFLLRKKKKIVIKMYRKKRF